MEYEDNIDTQDEMNRPPTQEEIYAAKLDADRKAALAQKTVAAMGAVEAQASQGAPIAPPTLPMGATPMIQGRGMGRPAFPGTPTVPVANTIPLSTPGKGRMYMGPNISDAQVRSLVPPGQSYSALMTPPGGSAPSQLEQAQALDRPGTRTLSIDAGGQPSLTSLDPGMRQFAARQVFQQAKAAGKSDQEALYMAGPDLFGGVAGALTKGKAPIVAPRWIPSDPATGAPGHFETGTGTVHIPTQPKPAGAGREQLEKDIRAFQVKLNSGELPSTKSSNPKIANSPQAKANDVLLAEWQKQLNNMSATNSPAATATGTTAVTPPGAPKSKAATSVRIRVKSPSGKVGTIPAGDWESAQAEGYTKL
jgi:hypothetical protein